MSATDADYLYLNCWPGSACGEVTSIPHPNLFNWPKPLGLFSTHNIYCTWCITQYVHSETLREYGEGKWEGGEREKERELV